MKNKVSIIVAVYKSEPFLNKCIESILCQSYTNLEIILVDDGSPDNSGKICDDYAKKDKRINVIHKKNGGACEARNFGLKKATGKYVILIDGDDWISEDHVEYLVNLVEKNQVDMAIGSAIFTTRDQVQTKDLKVEIVDSSEAVKRIIYPIIPIGPWNKIYDRNILLNNNLFFQEPWSGEGLRFSAKSVQYCKSIAIGNRKTYNYRLNNANSGLTNYKVDMGINAYKNIRLIRDELLVNNKKVDVAIKWHMWSNYHFILKLIIATDSKNLYKDLYKECIKENRRLLFLNIFKFEFDFKTKIHMILKSLFPVFYAKKTYKNEIAALKNDTME